MSYNNEQRYTTVNTTIETHKLGQHKIDEFRNYFRAVIKATGRKERRLNKMQSLYIQNPMGVVDMDFEEDGIFSVELTDTDLKQLMALALEGLEHRIFRDQHPAAMELWHQYMSMKSLTQTYKG